MIEGSKIMTTDIIATKFNCPKLKVRRFESGTKIFFRLLGF